MLMPMTDEIEESIERHGGGRVVPWIALPRKKSGCMQKPEAISVAIIVKVSWERSEYLKTTSFPCNQKPCNGVNVRGKP
jgi:hypothetical protein